jgi:hypothetical protein
LANCFHDAALPVLRGLDGEGDGSEENESTEARESGIYLISDRATDSDEDAREAALELLELRYGPRHDADAVLALLEHRFDADAESVLAVLAQRIDALGY